MSKRRTEHSGHSSGDDGYSHAELDEQNAHRKHHPIRGIARAIKNRFGRGGRHDVRLTRADVPIPEEELAARRERLRKWEEEHRAAMAEARARRELEMVEHEDALHVRNLMRDGRPQQAVVWGTPSSIRGRDDLNATLVVSTRAAQAGLRADLGSLTRVAAKNSDLVTFIAYHHSDKPADMDAVSPPTFVCYRPSTGTLLFVDGQAMPRVTETATKEGMRGDRGLIHWGLFDLGSATGGPHTPGDGLYSGNHEIVRLWADTHADDVDVVREVTFSENAKIVLGDHTQQQVHGDEIFGGQLAARGLYVDAILLDRGTVSYAANRVVGSDNRGWDGQVGNHLTTSDAPSPMLALHTLAERVDRK